MTEKIDWSEAPEKKLVWLTDLHLDAADEKLLARFYRELEKQEADLLLIGGDICNGIGCLKRLSFLQELLQIPVHFVLGNHDYYYASIRKNRRLVREYCKGEDSLHYLTRGGVVPLTEDVALIGHDGWADARAGDFLTSSVVLNDYLLIEELKNSTPLGRREMLHDLGNQAAIDLHDSLVEALDTFPKVLLLTHVPPYEEACRYKGEECDPNWGPHFVSQIVGHTLTRIMKCFPKKELLVLCGHSHSSADVQILPNLRVVAGESTLGSPSIQGIVQL